MPDDFAAAPGLRRFDIAARDFRRACAERLRFGEWAAGRDIALLVRLAQAVGETLGRWRSLLADLEFAAASPLDEASAREMVLETVFDPILEPEALRLLAAALDLEA